MFLRFRRIETHVAPFVLPCSFLQSCYWVFPYAIGNTGERLFRKRKTGLWPKGGASRPARRPANARGASLVLRGHAPMLGGHHLFCWAAHPCSGLRTAWARRATRRSRSRPGRRTAPGGAAFVLRGCPLRVGGEALVLRGCAVALCVAELGARLHAFALTIPVAGLCPRPDGLTQYRPIRGLSRQLR